MGCFDTVKFKCPNCGANMEEQSKAGDCYLKDYNMHSVPIVIAEDLSGESITCPECTNVFIMSNELYPKRVPLTLIPIDEIEDDGDW